LAEFFVRHAGTEYISHGELQIGRAEDLGQWSTDLAANVAEEIRNAISSAGTQGGARRVLVARAGPALAALAAVSLCEAGRRSYGIIEDLVVDSASRGRGIGSVVLQWIEREARECGMHRLATGCMAAGGGA
jgi:GNAT superfamily N-acetyltransferase